MSAKLILNDETLERLHHLADTRKKSVSVSSDTLGQLLVDYGAMYNVLRAKGLVTTPTPSRVRPKLTV